MCKFYKFYICAVVGIIIELLNNMHGVTTKNIIEFTYYITALF